MEAICDNLRGKKGVGLGRRDSERERQRVSAELFWSWCLSTLINAHRETPDGKERENERVEEEIWGEEHRGRRWSESGTGRQREREKD